MKKMTMTAALLAVTFAQAADFAVPENWRLRKLAGRELYACFHSGVWARDWETAPDWPMMKNVYMIFDGNLPVNEIVYNGTLPSHV